MAEEKPQPQETAKTRLGAIAGALLAALIAGGGIYAWQNQNLKTAQTKITGLKGQIAGLQTELEESKTANQAPAETPAPEDGSFQTYRSDKLGFEIDYPPGYAVEAQGEGIVIKSAAGQDQYRAVFAGNPLKLSLTEFVALELLKQNRGTGGFTLASQAEIQINGVKGIDTELAAKTGGKIRSVFLPAKGGEFVNIQYALTNKDEGFLKNGDKLVKSFRPSR